MDSSVLRFEDVSFMVGKGEKERAILEDVSGKVKYGHVLAIMGPSGAGKTTLISALTLDAHYGKPLGSVTLNGVPLTDKIFKSHCYVVKQHDQHWPYLTTRETLTYSAELYNVVERSHVEETVNQMIAKMGLDSCADTRAGSLSGGQKRRLSLAIALLKNPTLLFLDEPTSGLDAAAASNIMQEIARVARDERVIIVCTIHQPSTKVYNGFDQLMILSKGREAFTGNVEEAGPYFASIGYPIPEATNPAEHFLDLVNSDFSSHEEVERILQSWEQQKAGNPDNSIRSVGSTKDEDDDSDVTHGVDQTSTRGFGQLSREMGIMLRRHAVLVMRDPILYLGRGLFFLFVNLIFSFVYWNGRDYTQDQTTNKMWIAIWFIGVPTQMGVVAVYSLNTEMKSILRETKNGMVTALSYIMAKTFLVIPIIVMFAILAMGIPAFVVQDVPIETFGTVILLWSVLVYYFECAAEFFAVAISDPIIGMLNFMQIWFASFLFAGFLIPLKDMYWPFEAFYYFMPYAYFVRSYMYTTFTNSDFEPCLDGASSAAAVCVPSEDGGDVLEALGRIFPVVENDDQVWQDIGIMLALAMFWKILSVCAILLNTRKVANFSSHSSSGRRSKLSKEIKEVEVAV